MKIYKKGISLIVLVITVIVLAILATTVIVSISNTNIITKANDAVTEYNLKTYEDKLTIAYASWLIDNSGSTLTSINELESHGFDEGDLPANLRVVIEDGKPEIITVDVWDGTSIATSFSGGTGTEADPYLISTAAELAYFVESINDGTAEDWDYYKLTSNIDLNNKPWTPINTFWGNLNGNNYTIYNINIASTTGTASFINNAGNEWDDELNYPISSSIKNLKMEGGTITGVTAACFVAEGVCYITNCHNVGVNINGTTTAAGIMCSINYSTIADCTNSGAITGGEAYGIFASTSIGGEVDNSINYGAITATSTKAAGICCTHSYDDITNNCSNYGDIHGITMAAGIIVADNSITFNNDSQNYGNVTVADGGTIYTYDEAST